MTGHTGRGSWSTLQSAKLAITVFATEPCATDYRPHRASSSFQPWTPENRARTTGWRPRERTPRPAANRKAPPQHPRLLSPPRPLPPAPPRQQRRPPSWRTTTSRWRWWTRCWARRRWWRRSARRPPWRTRAGWRSRCAASTSATSARAPSSSASSRTRRRTSRCRTAASPAASTPSRWVVRAPRAATADDDNNNNNNYYYYNNNDNNYSDDDDDNNSNDSFLRGWIPHRGMVQVACNLMLPHDDDILNAFRIWTERQIRMRKPYRLPGWTKDSSYFSAPAGVWTHDLPHSRTSAWPMCPTHFLLIGFFYC